MRKSTDFRAWLSKEETKQELAGKEVLGLWYSMTHAEHKAQGAEG